MCTEWKVSTLKQPAQRVACITKIAFAVVLVAAALPVGQAYSQPPSDDSKEIYVRASEQPNLIQPQLPPVQPDNQVEIESPLPPRQRVVPPVTPASQIFNRGAPQQSQVVNAANNDIMWWESKTNELLLKRQRWVQFDMPLILTDTLVHSPQIKRVSSRASIALERITQQEAAFDPTLLLGADTGRTNSPVGNSLTTGGDSRLREETLDLRGGVQRRTRNGATLDVSQRLSLLDSNSTFLIPENQGISDLSISLTHPLLARKGRRYNERLLTQAKIDSQIAWQDMRADVEQRIASVMTTYWELYEARCHVIQQRDLLARGERVEALILARTGYDSSRIELAKVRQRIARRYDRLIAQVATIKRMQSQLATLVGSDALFGANSDLELLPKTKPISPAKYWELHDTLIQGAQFRPDIRAAVNELEAAALQVHVAKTELVPELNAIFDVSMGAISDDFDIANSLSEQHRTGPGIAGGLQFQMPRGRRLAHSRKREANHYYQQKSKALQEAMLQARFQIETRYIELTRTIDQHQSKRTLVEAAREEEYVLTRRWELIAGDGSAIGVVLENLLDAQQRRTDAEIEMVSTQADYMIAMVELQRAIGKLLVNEGITPTRADSDNSIDFSLTDTQPINTLPVTTTVHPAITPIITEHAQYAPVTAEQTLVQNPEPTVLIGQPELNSPTQTITPALNPPASQNTKPTKLSELPYVRR